MSTRTTSARITVTLRLTTTFGCDVLNQEALTATVPAANMPRLRQLMAEAQHKGARSRRAKGGAA